MFNIVPAIDIALTIALAAFCIVNVFLMKNKHKMFMFLIIFMLSSIPLAAILLDQQINLGGYIIVCTLFILVVVFFYLAIAQHRKRKRGPKVRYSHRVERVFVWSIVPILMVSLVYSFVNTQMGVLNPKNTTVIARAAPEVSSNPRILAYQHRMNRLAGSKIFQHMGEAIILYVGMIISVYFFSRQQDDSDLFSNKSYMKDMHGHSVGLEKIMAQQHKTKGEKL